jgi:hypothetical protein
MEPAAAFACVLGLMNVASHPETQQQQQQQQWHH